MATTGVSTQITTQTDPAAQTVAAIDNGTNENAFSDVDTEEDDYDDESCYSDETEGSGALEDVWEEEGMLHSHFESSYLNARGRRIQARQRGIVDYDLCTPAELKRFVGGRGLKDPYPKGLTLRNFYIRILEKADQELYFPFMELPPEMRLTVYRELLGMPVPSVQQSTTDWKVYPAILRTSKQVYKEAKGVLYDENVFSASFSIVALSEGDNLKTAKVHKDRYCRVPCCHVPYFRMPEGIDDYPDFFKRITGLEVQLEYNIESTVRIFEDGAVPLNNFVYTLASYLMDGHRLKHLDITLAFSVQIEDYVYELILYPLRRLRNVPHVTIKGYVPAHVKSKLISDVQSIEPVFNTMRCWKLLTDQAYTRRAIHEEMFEVKCACGACHTPDCFEELTDAMALVQESMEGSYPTSRSEENFIAKLANLRDVLREVEMERVEALMKQWIETTNAFKRYEAVTDDGRLDEAAKVWAGRLLDEDEIHADDGEEWSHDENDITDEQNDIGVVGHEIQPAETVATTTSVELCSRPTHAAPPFTDTLRTDEVDQMVGDALRGSAPISPSPEL